MIGAGNMPLSFHNQPLSSFLFAILPLRTTCIAGLGGHMTDPLITAKALTSDCSLQIYPSCIPSAIHIT